MSLQFIFGHSGSGKSYYLYKKIVDQSIEYPNTNFLVLVPEQFTMQTQKDLVLKHPNKGIMNIDVLSFGRLAHRIFEEVGGDQVPVLDDEGKNLILRKIAGDYEDNLEVLKGNLKKQGYISEVKSVISEFTQYDIGLEEMDRLLEELGEDSYLAYKLRDIRTVYEGFYHYLEDKYITKEELLDVLAGVVKSSSILKNAVVALDGFTGFTPVQNRLIGELLQVCDKVIITVEMDRRENPYVYNHPYQLFALSKQMATSLMEVARERGVLIEEPVTLYDNAESRYKDNPELRFLEENLFRYSTKKYELTKEKMSGNETTVEEQDSPTLQNIEIHCTRNPQEEADFAARQIRSLVRTKGYRYSDIAVITSDMGIYADYLEKCCSRYEIPIFMDHKRSVLLNAFVEYIRSLLDMVEQNFTYESVFRFLRTDFVEFRSDDIDELENYCVALGVRGYKKWQEAWVRRSRDMDADMLERVNHMRVQLVEKLAPLVFVLKQRSKTVKDVTLALYEFVVAEQMQEKLRRVEEKFQEEGELALAKEYAQIYRIVVDLFDKFVELLGDEKITLKEYCELIDAGFEEAKVGVIPPSLDQVVIGDMERTRLKDIKALFLVGANDTLLPGSLGQGGILSERDREHLSEEKITLSPGVKEKTYIQKFYLYLNLTKPTEHLYLTLSKVSADGKTLRASYLVQDLQHLYPQLRIKDEEKTGFAKREWTPDTGITYIIEGLRNYSTVLGDAWKELYTWYENNPQWRKKIERLVEASFYHREKDRLSKELAASMYGDLARLSVTRMEQFTACAYAHFLYYGLRLKEREEYRFEAMDLGNIAHSAMERFAVEIEREGVDWRTLEEEKGRELMDACVESSITDYGNTVLYSSARNEYMITRIKRMMHRTVWALTRQLQCGDFLPSEFEMNFGSGKIDRIDTCTEEDKLYVKVMDYKTGSKSFDITAVYHGLQLQLMVYMNAAMEDQAKKHPDKTIIPAGVFYYQMKDPIVAKVPDDKLEESILKELRLDGMVNADRDNLEHLERHLAGASLVMPIGRNKDESLSRSSKVLDNADFLLMSGYVQKKVAEIKDDITGGNVQAEPYELGDKNGCSFCRYHDICGFDERIRGCDRRRLAQYDKQEVLQKMKEGISWE
ncbi:helicase-exonuclease AddAB subunit AddB [Hespellia stercorisuis]|uniref:DNA helicase/exodeoxyribonuclease V, subunit B n=1 Tax=Hespellia stercorisuis DSM 15480 TaxID=1121950 RepID=A0A1M6T239_9FIRM|nr:helicase-exonuclease AddAB subunit AddB [Hespellia stercorisuis]SHK51053.1 DNA helicase/exodeoxyribonuclease V, subunit B [Hespellia stercorisuis DSM 15480]